MTDPTTDPQPDPTDPPANDPAQTDPPATDPPADPEPDSFPRAYVENLRRESAGYRDRARDRDVLAERLHAALVAATGRLADPTDLPFDDAHLADDGEALAAALDELLARKPHLASRRPSGDIGQGAGGGQDSAVDLAGILRAGAR